MNGFGFFPMSQETVTSLTSILPAVLLTLGLALSVLRDAYIAPKNRKVLLVICALMFVLILQNYMSLLFETRYMNPPARTVCSIVGYAVRPVILVLFCHIVSPKRRFVIAWVLVAVNAAVYLTALFSPLAFRINENNTFHRGPLNIFGFAVSIVLLAWLLYLSIQEFRSEHRRKNYILLLPVVMIIGAVWLDYQVGHALQPVTFLSYAVVLSSVFYFIWLHQQFVQAHEKAIIDGQRIQIMLSQIQPHFLFNSLEAIRALNRKDPAKGDHAIVQFERYLRGNMDALSQEEPIPFETELAHTNLYLEFEQYRFPDELHVVYDLSCKDFSLPPLTLQPLVENAVKHGVRGKKSGEGTVTIFSRAYPDRYEVTVADDGPGFDPDAVPGDDRQHVGLANVRERLRYAGAELRITVPPEGGTEATIVIPKIRDAGR